MKTITRWKKHMQFESSQHHNKIELDGDGKHGFGPKALLLAGLAGCSGIDVVDILKKMKVDLNSLEIDAEAIQTEDHPKVFKEVKIHYKVGSKAENEDKVRKAIELSLEKYCGVAAMLRKNSPINYSLEMIAT